MTQLLLGSTIGILIVCIYIYVYTYINTYLLGLKRPYHRQSGFAVKGTDIQVYMGTLVGTGCWGSHGWDFKLE